MNKPRYAIVRVDDNYCPSVLEDIYMEFGCTNKTNIRSKKHCKNCRYGDTKKQLIRKVAQAIKRKLKGGLILRNIKINETYNIQKTISVKAIAKEIVEFLGVEERKGLLNLQN